MRKFGKLKMKPRPFHWNGELNWGHLLTVATLIIAFIALLYQKKDLTTKVNDLKSVVDKLEKEKQDRELLGLDLDTKRLSSFNYTLGYTVDQVKALSKISDMAFMDVLIEANYLIGLLEKDKNISVAEKDALALIKKRNNAKKAIFTSSLWYNLRSNEFEERFAPKKENFTTDEEYLAASTKYTDTLQKNIDHLLRIMDSSIQAPKKVLTETADKFLGLEL